MRTSQFLGKLSFKKNTVNKLQNITSTKNNIKKQNKRKKNQHPNTVEGGGKHFFLKIQWGQTTTTKTKVINNKLSTYPTSPVFISKANRKKNVFTSFLSESNPTCCRIAHGQRWGQAGGLSPRISLWHRLALGVGDLLLRLTYGAYSCVRYKITDLRPSITHWITGSSFYLPLSLSLSCLS